MRELSIFVDESGDFGSYEAHSPFYLFTLVFHDQSVSIKNQIEQLERHSASNNLTPNHCFHAGPIIRREEDYQYLTVVERRKVLNQIFTFAKSVDFSYVTFIKEKKHLKESIDLTVALSKQLSSFIKDNYTFFLSFEKIVLYYDNGQSELGKLLATVFSILLPHTEIRKVLPVDYKLFQVADLICTLELAHLKSEQHLLSKSEEAFFGSIRDMKKNYIKPIIKKRYSSQSQ